MTTTPIENGPSEILGAAYRSALADDGGYVVLLGDLMVDIWLQGIVERQSPEDRDVPVFRSQGETWSLGGAGLVYAHLKAMGIPQIKFVTSCGADQLYPTVCRRIADIANGTPDGIFLCRREGIPTTSKLRAFDQHGRQRLRVDTEDVTPIDPDVEGAITQALRNYIGPQCRLVVVSDYNKGLLSDTVMAVVRDLCERRNVRFMADPARRAPEVYAGAYVICPNDDELGRWVGNGHRAAPRWENFSPIHDLDVEAICLTSGSDGVALSTYNPPHVERYPAWPVPEVKDVIGAGDAVTAGLAVMLCGTERAPLPLAAQFADMLGGWSVSQARTASPDKAVVERLIAQADGWMVWPETKEGRRQNDDREQPDVST